MFSSCFKDLENPAMLQLHVRDLRVRDTRELTLRLGIKDTFVIHPNSPDCTKFPQYWTFSTVTLTESHNKSFSHNQTNSRTATLITSLYAKIREIFKMLPSTVTSRINSGACPGPSKQVCQGARMMDGPWQEAIYNLSLPCLSIRQPSQTEEDKKRQEQKCVQRIDGHRTDAELVFSSAQQQQRLLLTAHCVHPFQAGRLGWIGCLGKNELYEKTVWKIKIQ